MARAVAKKVQPKKATPKSKVVSKAARKPVTKAKKVVKAKFTPLGHINSPLIKLKGTGDLMP